MQLTKVEGKVGCKYLRGCSRQSFKLYTITLRKPNDIANGHENSRNLRHCSRNHFSNKIKYKLQHFPRSQFISIISTNAIRFDFSRLCRLNLRTNAHVKHDFHSFSDSIKFREIQKLRDRRSKYFVTKNRFGKSSDVTVHTPKRNRVPAIRFKV